MNQNELAKWIMAETGHRRLSWSEACREAGVSRNTISEIVNGAQVGIKRLVALAHYFGVPAEHVLRLAGYLPPLPDSTDKDPRAVAAIDEIARLAFSLPREWQGEFAARLLVAAKSLDLLHLATAGRDRTA